MSSLIIPCAGKSTRFPGMKPKYLLTHPNGGLLMLEGIKGLYLYDFDGIYITILKEHDELYKASDIVYSAFDKLNFLKKLHITILDETNSQPETVAETIKLNNIEGHILIKDSDDYFESDIIKDNVVCYYDLAKMSSTNAINKSYITLNNSGYIDNIVEKRVISENFCCGGYSFKDAKEYLSYYHKLKDYNNLYISHIIYSMLLDGISFIPHKVKNYYDWGTLEEWNKYKSEFKTLFVDLDGVLVENSSEYSYPRWGDSKAIQKNVEKIQSLYKTGKVQIIITTARNEEYRIKTINQLNRYKIPYNQLIMGLNHCQRIIINDFADTNPFPSCQSINLERNSDKLEKYL